MEINMNHSQVFMRFPGGRFKALSFSFDDGSDQDEWVLALLKRLGLKGTFNLNAGQFAPSDDFDFDTLDRRVFPAADYCQRRLTRDRVCELFADSGMEIASHGYTHAELTRLNDDEVLWEVLRDRAELEEITGESVRGFAYPQGSYNPQTMRLLSSAGFEYARIVGTTKSFDLPRELMAWPISCQYGDSDALELCEKFNSLKLDDCIYSRGTESKLFTVFGHSYELDCRNNYDRLEAVAEALAGKDDVWYCTFIEYARYAKAFDLLDFNLAHTFVRNPSAVSVWIYANGETVEVPAGGSVKI